MKTISQFLLVMLGTLVGVLAEDRVPGWQPGDRYTVPQESSPWKSEELRRLEYRLIYLLEADRVAFDAQKELGESARIARKALHQVRDGHDEVLVSLYEEAASHLEATPNPDLLTKMLWHYEQCINSANERWEPVISDFRRFVGTGDTPPHLTRARTLLGAITPETNLYTASPSRIVWPDEANEKQPALNHSVCSSFGALVLRKTYGIDRAAEEALFGEVAPEADDFYVAMKDSGAFEIAPTVTEIRPGDFLVVHYLSNKAIPTGHVMLVDGPARRVAEHDAKNLPWPRPTETAGVPIEWDSPTLVEWHISILDSSKSPHGKNDTRSGANADGSNDNGLGRGDLRILTDPDGKMVGYTWSTESNSRLRTAKERPMLAGRYRHKTQAVTLNR